MRNLILGFGVLLLMFASVAVLARHGRSRRASRAAADGVRRGRLARAAHAGVGHRVGGREPRRRLRHRSVARQAVRARIQTEARRLGDTVERVLLYAGIEAGRGDRPSHADGGGRRSSADALAACSDAIEEARATVETDIAPDLPPILADAMGLRSSLQNLIANALKYGGAGRWVRVAAIEGQRRAAAPRCASPSVTADFGIAPADSAAHLRAVLSRRRSAVAPDSRQRARPQHRQGHRRGAWRARRASRARPGRAARSS